MHRFVINNTVVICKTFDNYPLHSLAHFLRERGYDAEFIQDKFPGVTVCLSDPVPHSFKVFRTGAFNLMRLTNIFQAVLSFRRFYPTLVGAVLEPMGHLQSSFGRFQIRADTRVGKQVVLGLPPDVAFLTQWAGTHAGQGVIPALAYYPPGFKMAGVDAYRRPAEEAEEGEEGEGEEWEGGAGGEGRARLAGREEAKVDGRGQNGLKVEEEVEEWEEEVEEEVTEGLSGGPGLGDFGLLLEPNPAKRRPPAIGASTMRRRSSNANAVGWPEDGEDAVEAEMAALDMDHLEG